MSGEERLLSVAEIARKLGVPESTLHYWKNRFAQHLPSVGAGRQKRFRPEAVEVFRVIAEMFSLGHSTSEVMEELGKRFPLTAQLAAGPGAAAGTAFGSAPAGGEGAALQARDADAADTALRMAAAIGREIARSIGEGLGRLSLPAGAGSAALPAAASQDLDAIKSAVEQGNGRLKETSGEVEHLAAENADLKKKLSVLEAELVRLRKDRRELEKYLLDKIKSMAS